MVIYEVYSELLGIYYIGQKKSNHKNNKKLQKLSGMILKFNILKDEITFNSKS